jgi:hypothetical protein
MAGVGLAFLELVDDIQWRGELAGAEIVIQGTKREGEKERWVN